MRVSMSRVLFWLMMLCVTMLMNMTPPAEHPPSPPILIRHRSSRSRVLETREGTELVPKSLSLPSNVTNQFMLRSGTIHSITWKAHRMEGPRILYLHETLTPTQCDAVVNAATRGLQRKKQMNLTLNESAESWRYSFRNVRPNVTWAPEIARTVAQLVGVAASHVDVLGSQILRYLGDQSSSEHYDGVESGRKEDNSVRIASLLLWLSNVTGGGGETVFPTANVSFSPRVGDGILFYHWNRRGARDVHSRHSGMRPTSGGVKWIMTTQIWNKPCCQP